MPRYLRKKDTDEIFIHTELLAKRDDMVPYEMGAPVTLKDDAPDQNKISLIVEALGKMSARDFTATGTPKLKVLERILGEDISADERDEAWAIYQS